MQLTASQLQTQHKALVDALKRGQTVEITYHGEVLGVVHPKKVPLSKDKLAAADAFFGMRKDQSADSVEDEVRTIRKGRRKRFDDL